MASKEVNKEFKDAIKRLWLGLAAQVGQGKSETDIRGDQWLEMLELGLLPSSKGDQETNPLDYWSKGHVPADWKVVRYLAELGFKRAMLREPQHPRQQPWLKEFLRAAGYSQAVIQGMMEEMMAEQAELAKGVRHNLPQYDPSRFVGRQEELATLRRLLLLTDRTWVITVNGSGGVGKSELVLALADGYAQNYATLANSERFQAIVWFSAKQWLLTLDGIVSRGRWSQTLSELYVAIARTLGLQNIIEADEVVRRELVIDALTRQRTLLIIDDIETVKDETLISFIREVPFPTKVIVTTRHRIDVAREIRLTGLSPEDAYQLINQEASLKGLTLAGGDRERLYELTDGVPLAMIWTVGKMAFGLTPAVALRQLTEPRADINRFCLEADIELIGTRDAYPLLLALALCTHDATREALGAAAGLEDDNSRRDQGLYDLEVLSLVNRDRDTDRFSLLPLTRHYLMSRLASAKEMQQRLFDGLVVHYKRMFLADEGSHHARYWQGLTRTELFGTLETEWVNLRDILYRLHEDGAHRELLGLGLPLVHLLNYLGPWPERLMLCRWMAESARALEDGVEAWLLIDGLGWILLREGQYDDLLDVLNNGRRVAGKHADLETALILADAHEAYVHIRQGHIDRARQLLERADARLAQYEAAVGVDPIRDVVASRVGDRWVRVFQAEGDLKRARELNRRSLSLKRTIGEDLASTHYNIGFLSLQLHDLDAARNSFLEAMEYPYHRKYQALSRYGLAQVAEHEQNWLEAARQGQRAAAQLEQLGLYSLASEAEALVQRVQKLS